MAFPASNLITSDRYKKWQTLRAGEGKAFVVIKLEKPAVIRGIDIGNEGSAFIEVLASANGKDFVVLLPTSSFMSPMEARNDEERTRVRMFTKLAESACAKVWSYIKVICSQPFNKTKPFGITFIRIHGPGKTDKQDNFDQRTSLSQNDTLMCNTQEAQSRKGTGPSKTTDTETKQLAPPNRGREVESDDEIEREGEAESFASRADSAHPSTLRQSAPGSVKKSSQTEKAAQRPDPSKIMQGVTFALSGFQNPLRSQIRMQALSMGAKYMPDWSDECTHLICAFANTPKWAQVAAIGGKIVTRDWIDACKQAGAQIAWRNFKCGKYRDKVLDVVDTPADDDSEADKEEEATDDGDSDYIPTKEEQIDMSHEKRDDELNESLRVKGDDNYEDREEDEDDFVDDDSRRKKRPRSKKRFGVKSKSTLSKDGECSRNDTKLQKVDSPSKQKTTKNSESLDESMDEDDDVPEWDGGDLGRFFGGKTFYIKSDVENEEDRNTLVKYIVAHCGSLTRNAAAADFVVSWEAEERSSSASSMRSPLWVVKCHQENRLVEE
ncbi:DNA repair protein XRCC1-like isoform X4 [Varroa jacobsoni]|uniref:DNA repair protein XRCC1-like isoform X4 n=1 Tax=Varroa jacobsoni TaxID=62625 RepID=UPI000BFA5B02|nr:DNA repair protein XRCC1-like isoform X4 [Varroa jacobsoni]